MGSVLNILFGVLTTFCMFPLSLFAQGDKTGNATAWELKKSIKAQGDYVYFQVDPLGNYYLLSRSRSQIKKLDKNGDSIGRYDNSRQFGPIARMDVSNPLKIALYYQDFSTVVILDRFLNEVNVIDLRRAGVMQAAAVATSYDNAIWAYDQQAAKIIKIDGQGKVQFSSSDLRNVFESPINPSRIMDNNGLLYLYDRKSGWYLFDYYGGFKQLVSVTGLKDVGVIDGTMVGRKEDQLWQFNPKKTYEPTLLPLASGINAIDIQQVQVQDHKLYIRTKSDIECFIRRPAS